MSPNSKIIAFISIMIWITALLINTALGIYILEDEMKINLLALAGKGMGYGAIFSFPVFLIVWLMLYVMHKSGFTAANIYLILLFVGALMSLVSFYLFSEYMQLSATVNIPLGQCALFSSVAAILLQFNPLRKVCFRRDHPGHFEKNEKVIMR